MIPEIKEEKIFSLPIVVKTCTDCGGHCCRNCYISRGYLTIKEFNAVKKKYKFVALDKEGHHIRVNPDWKTTDQGFFRAGKGCILPREMRSPTCRGYGCEKLHKVLVDNVGQRIIDKFQRIFTKLVVERYEGRP